MRCAMARMVFFRFDDMHQQLLPLNPKMNLLMMRLGRVLRLPTYRRCCEIYECI